LKRICFKQENEVLRSMTGFGRAVFEDEESTQIWEVKSVNSRYLDLKWRLPQNARSFEPRLEKIVRNFATRGRIEISLNLNWHGAQKNISFDQALASAMIEKMKNLSTDANIPFKPDLNTLFTVSSLWMSEQEDANDDLPVRLEAGLIIVLQDWNEARETEARALAQDIKARLLRLEEWLTLINDQTSGLREERFAMLRERVNELLSAARAEMDENRLMQEMALLSDKLDVSEEITRLRAHLDRLRELLENGNDAGRRLDFTLQECFREITTCGNKIQHALLSRVVVDFKNELEKCREQVQNLE
jgi:uncharacterized protein (TIGR00255 family)